jgi:hypothetical protein
MTIHAAKGLEFDTCFLVNMHQRRREDTSLPRIRELPGGEIEVTALGATEGDPSAKEPDEPNRVEEEEKRLLYVALTRARRRLVLSAVSVSGIDSERSFLGLLPRTLREKFRDDRDEVEWRGHRLPILRRSERRTLPRSTAAPSARLRLDPLAPDAYEVLEPASEACAATGETSVPAEVSGSGRVYRQVPFALARGALLHRGVFELLIVGPESVTVVSRSDADRRSIELQLEAAKLLAHGRRVIHTYL